MLDLRIVAVSAVLALGACTQNDQETTRRVQARLADEGIKDEVKVTVDRRVVVLEGVVANRAELNRAELAARNTRGILGVDNRLVIQQPVTTTGAASDEADASDEVDGPNDASMEETPEVTTPRAPRLPQP